MKLTQISILLALLCPTVFAQSSEIFANIVVKDKKGAPVKNLTADQIEMTDGGNRVQPIVRLFDGADVVENGQRKPAEPLRRIRLIPIVFEGMDNQARRLGKQTALDLLKEDKDPSHLFAVFNFSNQLSLLQPFTTNRAALTKAIDTAMSGQSTSRFADVHKEMKTSLEAIAGNRQALTDADVAPDKLDTSVALQGALARLQLAMMSETVIDDAEGTRRSFTFLNAMIQGLKTMPGRKSLAYLNTGVRVPPNLDVAFEAMLARANSAGVSIYPIDCRGISSVSQGAGVAQSTNDSQIQVSGLENRERGDNTNRIDNVVEGLRNNVQSAPRTIAEATGGVATAESNDAKKQLREMIADAQSYYELSYDPRIDDYSGLLRRTTFKLKAGDYKVRGRMGYLALAPGQENLLPYEVPLMKALNATPLTRDVEFQAGTWKLQSTRDSVQAMVAVEVPFANISFAQDAAKGNYAARISLVTQVRDPQGKVIEKFTRDLPLMGKLEQLEALKTSNFNFRERFSVPPGRYVIETAVIDQLSTKVGARKTSFIAAAAKSPLAMSSVTVVRNFQPNAKGLTPEEPYQFQGGRITPTLNETMKKVKGATIALFFVVYPEVGVAPPQAVVQYFKDGEVAGTANLQLPSADAQGRINYVLSSPMDAMQPGTYEIKVLVKQGVAAVTESVFLTIGA